MENISASILGQDNKIKLVNKLIKNGIIQIHYDVMDGLFISGRHSLPIEQIENIVSNTNKHIVDIHLMVNSPETWIRKVAKISDYVTFHYESESINKIKKIYLKLYGTTNIGIAISPKTNVEQIYEFLYDSSHVLVMSVIPGKGGQSFINDSIDKIKKLRKYIDDHKLDVVIQVDGGINNITAKKAFEAGADSLVSGSYIVNILNDKTLLKKLQKK